MNWTEIDFQRAGQLLVGPDVTHRIIALLTGAKDDHDDHGALLDLDAFAELASDPEHAVAAIQFLLGITLAALDALEDQIDVDRWLQRMALHYS